MDKIIIYWDTKASRNYLSGSTIEYNDDEVNFKNEMISASTILKIWESKTSYNASRRIPELPLLETDKEYTLKADLETNPEDTAMFEINFYNVYSEIIETVYLKSKEVNFKYPANATKYSITMINAGLTSFLFKKLELFEKSNSEEIEKETINIKNIKYDVSNSNIDPFIKNIVRKE
jgi:accessory secretory protein Asp3